MNQSNTPKPTTTQSKEPQKSITTLDALVNDICFCKLRSHCPDKNSPECLKHRNLYAEFMLQKHAAST